MHVLSFFPLTELAVVERGSGSWHSSALHARLFNFNLSRRVPFGSTVPLALAPPARARVNNGWRIILLRHRRAYAMEAMCKARLRQT